MRPGPLARVWVIGFTLFWCGLLIAHTVNEWPIEPSLLLLRGVGVVLAASLAYRTAGVRVAALGDVLVVRNLWRTRRVHRADVQRVWLGEPLTAELPGGWLPGPRGEAINVEASEGSFTIDVTRDWLGIAKIHERLLTLTAELEDWRIGRSGGPGVE